MCEVPFGAIQALLHSDSPFLLPPSPSRLPPTQTHSPGAFRGLGSLLAMLISSAPVLHLGYILCMFTSHWLAQPNKSSPVPAWDITRPLLSSAKAKCEVLRLEGIFSCGTRDAITQRLPGERTLQAEIKGGCAGSSCLEGAQDMCPSVDGYGRAWGSREHTVFSTAGPQRLQGVGNIS